MNTMEFVSILVKNCIKYVYLIIPCTSNLKISKITSPVVGSLKGTYDRVGIKSR